MIHLDISSGIDNFFTIYQILATELKNIIITIGPVPAFSVWDLIWSLVFFDIGLMLIVIVVRGFNS